MKIIKQTYLVRAPIKQVWQALVNPKEIDNWGGGPAKISDKVGTKFSLWGGSIWGTNTAVVPEKKLEQDWFSDSDFKKWEKPSKATFTLNQEKNRVRLNLLHKDVPDADLESINEGWKIYYLQPLKEYLEKTAKE